jgi:hypothetical protein
MHFFSSKRADSPNYRKTQMFGRNSPEKGQILLRKRREVTRKFGRHVVTDKKVWPSFGGVKIPDAILMWEVHCKTDRLYRENAELSPCC